MSDNYFMSDEFTKDATKSVREAIEQADALGLPKVYSPAPALPTQPVIVRLTTKKKQQEAIERSRD